MIFVCSATHKTKSMFFFLLQTEQGDIFKVTLETDEEMVTEIKLKYFDTVPVATSLCVLKTGFLFVASEFGNQSVLKLRYSSFYIFRIIFYNEKRFSFLQLFVPNCSPG